MELWKLLGDLHPKLVQFPLVLLLCGLVFDLVGLIRRSRRFHWAAVILSSTGTVFLLLAFICGIYAEIWAGRAGVPQAPIEWHEFVANVASWGFVILTAWRVLIHSGNRKALAAYTAIGLCYYVLLALTAYLGGQLVFHYGAAVVGARASTVLSLHDLNTLATRQTDLNLKYSEMMHHIFGWLTLALSGSLLATALFPKARQKVRLVGPALLLLGGIFLFFFADLDLYRLTDLRQWGDREVELHKTIAILLTVIGAGGLLKKPTLAQTPGLRVFPQCNSAATKDNANLISATEGTEVTEKQRVESGFSLCSLCPLWLKTFARKTRNHRMSVKARMESPSDPRNPGLRGVPLRSGLDGQRETGSKPIAIMALIGGGLLFTHVHTVAPYANVAAGVYIAHVVLGVTALCIGGARLLQDGLPKYRRALATVFAATMCVEALLLITYNEGLPWYIGYGRYNRWGQHPGGTVAPYGDLRAELTFDNESQQLDVYTLDRFADQPRPINAGAVQLLIGQGYHEVSVELKSTDKTHTHYLAIAPWLKDAPAFSARLRLPVNGSWRMGYFDPWVASVIAPVPPNELARYQCPMHDGFHSQKPGNCKVCGMQLVPLQSGARTALHDESFGLELALQNQFAETAALDPVEPTADPLQQRLIFTPKKGTEVLRDLPVVHEHPLHVTVLSSDLRFFDHVHPQPQADGSLQLDYRFPRAGSYVVFGEYMPAGQRDQAFRFPVTVGDSLLADQPNLEATIGDTKPIDAHPEMTAELICQPRSLTAGTHAMLLFRLADHGRPVTDLQPYMAALGHCAIVSEDTQTFLHCHPEQVYPTTRDSRGGPDIAFHAIFPHPGKYKIWGQFQRDGKVVIADFVVEVKSPILPAKVVNFILNDY